MTTRRAWIPNILVLVLLRRDPQLLLTVDTETVLRDEGVGVVTGMLHFAVGRAVIIDVGERGADHQRMIALTGIDHRRPADSLTGAVVAGSGFGTDAGREFRLRHQHIDHATHRPRAIKYGCAPLDHFDALGHAEAHE